MYSKKAVQRFLNPNPLKHNFNVKVPAEITVWNCSQDIDAADLCKKIEQYKQQYPRSMGEVQYNTAVHAWHSDFRTHTLTDILDPLIKLKSEKIKSLEDLTGPRGPNLTPVGFSVEEIWINCYQKGDSASRHNHGYIGYSTIYFAHAEDSATPVIFDNNIQDGFVPIEIVPYTGMLIVFPSFVFHRVPPVKESLRITVASNCFQKVRARTSDLKQIYTQT